MDQTRIIHQCLHTIPHAQGEAVFSQTEQWSKAASANQCSKTGRGNRILELFYILCSIHMCNLIPLGQTHWSLWVQRHNLETTVTYIQLRSDLILTTYITITMLHYDKLRKSKSLSKVVHILELYHSVKKSHLKIKSSSKKLKFSALYSL